MQFRNSVCIVTFALLGGLGSTTAVADEMFLKFVGGGEGDIIGGSTDPQHLGELVLLSFDVQVDADSSWSRGGGASVGKPNPGKMNWEHSWDRSGPTILRYIATGTSAPSATLTVRSDPQGNKAGFEYAKYTFTNIFFTSIGQGLNGPGRAVSKGSFVYRTVRVEAFAPSNPVPLSCALWDVVAGTVTDCR